MTKTNPNLVDKSKSDAKNPTGACPLMKQKVQLLPLRYGLVERLDPKAELSLPYKTQSQPLGIRLLRDGWLYVIDNSTGYLHEYQVESGVVSKKLWQGQEATQDKRQGSAGENTLIFPRGSTLHISYSEVQWTAAKCSRMLASRKERDHFMQAVDLSKATCDKGGKHLLSTTQAQKWIAEVAEQPAETSLPEGANPQEAQDYAWEDHPLYAKTSFGAIKKQLQATYEHDHLYLVFKDSLGVMRDLAQAQDTVVSWIQKWVEQERNDLRYMVGNYIETLIVVNDDTAAGVASSTLFEKTTPAQRQSIYDYLNTRNELKGKTVGIHSSGRGYDMQTIAAKAELDAKQAAMQESLGDELYGKLEGDIEALQDSSDVALQGKGKGLGARGIQDLVRHEEMRQYLEGERIHLKRWNARLDLITEDRVSLFTQEEYHRSAWYFDADVPDQLQASLTAEQNCVRDMCRTEESVKEVGEFFHEYPYYILPAFASRLDLNFLLEKKADLTKWLDDVKNLSSGLQDAQARDVRLNALLGNHWAGNPAMPANTQAISQAVLAAYSPAVALRMQDWLAELQAKLDSPELKSHLDKLKTFTNRAQRLGALADLKRYEATLQVATDQDVNLFKANLIRLIELLEDEDDLIKSRNAAKKDSQRRMSSADERQRDKLKKIQLNNQLQVVRQQRQAHVAQMEGSVIVTSTQPAGFVGVKMKIDPAQRSLLDEETRRLKAGVMRGYGEAGAVKPAFKSAALPLAALFFQVSNLEKALDTWSTARRYGGTSFKQDVIVAGAIFSPVASALSVYQNVHISIVDGALKAIATSSGSQGGMQFAAKLGKLGLVLGAVISPFALVGSIATSWDNLNKWTNAMRTGTAGEQAGALLALTGDTSSTLVNTVITSKAFAELGGLITEVARADAAHRRLVASRAWATRGTRFLSFSARLSPWGLASAALQFGGEALYNYNNLDDQQRWLFHCYWGINSQGWDWPTHAQGLAEATLQPIIQDKGIIQKTSNGESIRQLLLTLPGINLASFNQQPFRLAAQYLGDDRRFEDVGQLLASSLRTVSDAPLILALDIPAEWSGLQSQLLLRLAVQPTLAKAPLKRAQGGLYYAIPLSSTAVTGVVKATAAPEINRIAPHWLTITREHLNAAE